MKNLIKEYFESGKTIEDLKNEFGISANTFDDLIIFNYSQIDSPKTDPLVRMCRGIVVEKDTWNIVHYPFYRFFNFEEVLDERQRFNWNNAVATEKVDGSLFGVFFHKDKWYICTRSQIGGNNTLSIGSMTFGDLFNIAIDMPREEFFSKLSKEFDYTFELVSPYNQIVTPYSDTKLYILGARDISSFHEISMKDILKKVNALNDMVSKNIVRVPKHIPLVDETGKFRGFDEMKKLAEAGESTDEGFVVVDYSSYDETSGSYPRVKVKNTAYVALHHLRGNIENATLNTGNILSIIFKNEQDEVLSTFPAFKDIFDDMEKKYNNWLSRFAESFEKVKTFFDIPMEQRLDKDIKKNFALSIDKEFSKFLFFMFNFGYNDIHSAIEAMANNKSNFWKDLWNDQISK